jgi:hypothetical protein
MAHTMECLLLSSKRKIVINSKKLGSCKFYVIAITTREICRKKGRITVIVRVDVIVIEL